MRFLGLLFGLFFSNLMISIFDRVASVAQKMQHNVKLHAKAFELIVIMCFACAVISLMRFSFAACTCVVHKRCHALVLKKCPGSKPEAIPVRY